MLALSAGASAREARRDPSTLDDAAIAADRVARIPAATWPGQGAPDEAAVFGGPIPPQGPPPPRLAPAQASLHPQQCARCHAKQTREWSPSRHAGAASPGLAAQMFDLPRMPDEVASCLRCHAPLAEQRADEQLRATGVGCAGCHVRGWTRRGPPNVAPSLLPIPGYPLQPLALYERGDFCLPCHQLPPRTAVAGRPLLNTYKEWLEGPYMRRGVQCQHCHMPNREHAFLGVHDPDTFRQGIALVATATAKAGTITVVAELANVGAGHYLPTTPTPAAWLAVQLLDARGRPIAARARACGSGATSSTTKPAGTRSRTRASRPAGNEHLARAWTGGRTAEAAVRASPSRSTPTITTSDSTSGSSRSGSRPRGARCTSRRSLARVALATSRSSAT